MTTAGNLDQQAKEELLSAARRAAIEAYSPYSRFHVGAAILTDRGIITGCNIENASYGLTICAERCAIFSSVASGLHKIRALAVSCPDASPDSPPEHRMPCGACLQVMGEFGELNMPILVDGVGEFRLKELLPRRFSLKKAP